MNYQLQHITAKLETMDIEKTIKFYETVLGFSLTGKHEGHVFLSKGENTIMFCSLMDYLHQKRPIMTGSLYLYSPDVSSIYHKIKDKVQICYPLEDFGYGMREFGFFDNNGYLLQFGMSIGKIKGQTA